jgi:hypothetical protein
MTFVVVCTATTLCLYVLVSASIRRTPPRTRRNVDLRNFVVGLIIGWISGALFVVTLWVLGAWLS